MKLPILVIIAWIFFCETIQGHPTEAPESSFDESDLYGIEVYDPEKIKNLNVDQAIDIVRKYFPESEIEYMGRKDALPTIMNQKCRTFNKMASKPMTFREFIALQLFKTYAAFYLYPQNEDAESLPYTAYEVTRALITMGERMRHYEVDMKFDFSGRLRDTGCTTSNPVLWRGEIRDKTDVDTMLNSRLYMTGDRFVSFTKGKKYALGFMVEDKKKDHQVYVLYMYTNPGPIYHLDIARATSSSDYEEEIILYPIMEFRVVDIQDLFLNGKHPYKLVHIENGRSIDYEEWKRNNHKILTDSYKRARRISNFDSAAAKLKET